MADDHAIFRAGTRATLESDPGIKVIGEAQDGVEALHMVRALQPDVLLLDVEMPKMSGVEVARQLRKEEAPVRLLALSAYNDREYVYGLLDNGASGYLLKDEAETHLIVEAVHGVARGEDDWISRSLATHLLRHRRLHEDPTLLLSEREQEVLRHAALGLDNDAIGERLFISPYTVKNHLDKIKAQKVGVRTRTELVIWAWQNGLVKRGDQIE